MDLPLQIYTGAWDTIHIQGIGIDAKREYIYYSFTTVLVKANLKGEIIGTVTGVYGHLGCLAYCPAENRVYASLEFKNDAIGKMVQKNTNAGEYPEESFHIAIFDCEKIDRANMDAFGDGVMVTVRLHTVADDYTAKVGSGGNAIRHRYGCSGIDGISFGPDFGSKGGKHYLCVAYGIYSDAARRDNDHQVILQYDISGWPEYESSGGLGKRGVEAPRGKYFVYTGNTKWGIQNLEYDPHTHRWLAAVYRGSKRTFPNYTLFSIDGGAEPELGFLRGVGETGSVLALSKDGLFDEKSGIYGYECYDAGSGKDENSVCTTGMASLGDGRFYISHAGRGKEGSFSNIYLCRWTGGTPCPFEMAGPA